MNAFPKIFTISFGEGVWGMKTIKIQAHEGGGYIELVPNYPDEGMIGVYLIGPRGGVRATEFLDQEAVRLLIDELQEMEKEVWGGE